VLCRPAADIEEGRGIVRLYLPHVIHASDDYKWEIKRFGAGYTVQRVSPSISLSIHSPLSDANHLECSLPRENPNSFVLHWMGSRTGLGYAPSLTLWLGESKPSTTASTVGLNTSGQIRCPRISSRGALTPHSSFYWGTNPVCWDLGKDNGVDKTRTVRYKPLIPVP